VDRVIFSLLTTPLFFAGFCAFLFPTISDPEGRRRLLRTHVAQSSASSGPNPIAGTEKNTATANGSQPAAADIG
jgi:hypothetical protein